MQIFQGQVQFYPTEILYVHALFVRTYISILLSPIFVRNKYLFHKLAESGKLNFRYSFPSRFQINFLNIHRRPFRLSFHYLSELIEETSSNFHDLEIVLLRSSHEGKKLHRHTCDRQRVTVSARYKDGRRG